MDHALDMHPHIGVLEALDANAAAVAMRKKRKRVARDLFENGIVVSTGQRHRSGPALKGPARSAGSEQSTLCPRSQSKSAGICYFQ